MSPDTNSGPPVPAPEDRDARVSGENGHVQRVGGASITVRPRSPVSALVPAREFYRAVQLEIVARLEASTTVDLLDGADDSGSRVIPRPDEYHGYVVRYSFPTTHSYTLLFTKSFLTRGSRYRLGGDANYFSSKLNLVAAAIDPADADPIG